MQRRRQHNNGDLNNIDVLPPPGSGTEEEGRNWQWTSLSQAMCGRQSGDAAGSGSPDSATLHVQHGHPRRRTAHLALALRVLDCALLRRVLSVATNWLGRQSPLMCVSISWRFHARSPFLAAPDEMEQPLLILFDLSVRFSCDSKTSLRTAEKKDPKLG